MTNEEEVILYQTLCLKRWLKRRVKENAIDLRTFGMNAFNPTELKLLQKNAEWMFSKAKRRKATADAMFRLMFKTLDLTLDAAWNWRSVIEDHIDRMNSLSEQTYDTEAELEIYRKRFGEIPRKEIKRELYGPDPDPDFDIDLDEDEDEVTLADLGITDKPEETEMEDAACNPEMEESGKTEVLSAANEN